MSYERRTRLPERWQTPAPPVPPPRQYQWLLLIPLLVGLSALLVKQQPVEGWVPWLQSQVAGGSENRPMPWPAGTAVTAPAAGTAVPPQPAARPTPTPPVAQDPVAVSPPRTPRTVPGPMYTEAQLLARHARRRAEGSGETQGAAAGSLGEGQAGLVEAMRNGSIRPASSSDLARWKQRHAMASGRPPGTRFDEHTARMSVYLIQRDFRIPDGLSGAGAVVFILAPTAPFPQGDPGHSPLLDLETGSCSGMICPLLLSDR
jgi:hypothetical protein